MLGAVTSPFMPWSRPMRVSGTSLASLPSSLAAPPCAGPPAPRGSAFAAAPALAFFVAAAADAATASVPPTAAAVALAAAARLYSTPWLGSAPGCIHTSPLNPWNTKASSPLGHTCATHCDAPAPAPLSLSPALLLTAVGAIVAGASTPASAPCGPLLEKWSPAVPSRLWRRRRGLGWPPANRALLYSTRDMTTGARPLLRGVATGRHVREGCA